MRRDKGRLSPFVPLILDTMRTPAWRALTHGARSLYISLKQRYNKNTHNNGRLFVSSRDAERELGSNRNSVLRWFRELQHYGFIIQTSGAALGLDGKGKAPHWRLTELGYMRDPPTREFAHWSGTKFRETKKQNPGPNSGARVAAIVEPVAVPLVEPVNGTSGPNSGAICPEASGSTNGAITSINHWSASALSSASAIAVQRERLNDLSRRLAVFAPIRVVADIESDQMGRS